MGVEIVDIRHLFLHEDFYETNKVDIYNLLSDWYQINEAHLIKYRKTRPNCNFAIS